MKRLLLLFSLVLFSFSAEAQTIRANSFYVSSATYPADLLDGNTVAWYVADDLSTITKDGSNLVSQWSDRLGSGHDLLQATATYKPVWSASDGVYFDGNDNYMKTAAFTYNQPEYVFMVVKAVTWGDYKWFFDGISANNGSIIQTANPTGATPDIKQRQNAYYSVSPISTFALGTWGILTACWNGSGAASYIQYNNGTQIAGHASFGTTALGGITIAARPGVETSTYNIRAYYREVICRTALTSDEKTAIYNYLATKYGL